MLEPFYRLVMDGTHLVDAIADGEVNSQYFEVQVTFIIHSPYLTLFGRLVIHNNEQLS